MYRRSIPRSNLATSLIRQGKVRYSTQKLNEASNFDFFTKETRSVTTTQDSSKTGQGYASHDKETIHNIKTITRSDMDKAKPSRFRNSDGSVIKGETSEEARLDDSTLEGRVDHKVSRLPKEIAKAIQNNILATVIPSRLRERVTSVYQDMSKNSIQRAPVSSLDVDAHIAACFLQDYSHSRQVLLELQKRVGEEKFNPRKVLSVGYGPATGMVALNEIMGPNWVPEIKDAYIVGRNNGEMKKRAKIILSRQPNENVAEQEEPIEQKTNVEEPSVEPESAADTQEYKGPVDTNKLNIQTKLKNTIPTSKQYDLIIVNSSLLSRAFSFPRDVDVNIRMILSVLAPNGHIVLIERGNSVGFETIARARQLMIRPEGFPSEMGKIPRPYIKGSSVKPQRVKEDDELMSEQDLEHEKELLAKWEKEERELLEKGQGLEQELDEKFGQVTEDELKFEDEDEVEVFQADTISPEKIDYHMSILAPCPHHHKCPLQMGHPKYYSIPSHSHRFNFCSFSKVVERPNYTMELKKGKLLATSWDKHAEDGIGKTDKSSLKKMEGGGRPGGRNTEDGSYSYLIGYRSPNDEATIEKIENDRKFNDKLDFNNVNHWSRIIENPNKLKGNVKMTVCSTDGNIETWNVPKSLGKQPYHDARKAQMGDLWALNKKGVQIRNTVSDKVREKLDLLYKVNRKKFLKEQSRKTTKKKTGASVEEFEEDINDVEEAVKKLESSRKYKAGFKKLDVDPDDYVNK
ncbi:37S ribosomal protein S22 mitochondrial [Spathaspora sp. JA1]|nr:37S ribosomal protein S22 mitochondrial [Spathaspora sp. JA1]